MALAGATVRRPIGSSLDLGTGCGIQALFAAAHSDRVVASDVNPRAVALATLTMALNGAGNVEMRTGDLLDPVAGETFGLVVANPPFVISPSERYLFRDGDAAGRRAVPHARPVGPRPPGRGRPLPVPGLVGPRRRRGLARPARGLVRRDRLRRPRAGAGGAGSGGPRGQLAAPDRGARPLGARIRPVDGLLRAPADRRHRSRARHDAAAGRWRRRLVPGGGGGAGLRHAVRRPPRRRVRARRPPRRPRRPRSGRQPPPGRARRGPRRAGEPCRGGRGR